MSSRLLPLIGACSVLLAWVVSCSSTDEPAPPTDTPADAAPAETGLESAAPDAPDAASEDAGEDAPVDAAADTAVDSPPDDAPACEPLDGLGTVVCTCDELDEAVWSSSTPFLIRGSVDLGTTGWDPAQLTVGGQKIVADGNLGGSSVESEAIAYDILARCELATLLKSEGEIDYTDTGGKKTDELVSIDSRKVGVSVTRAYHYPPTEPCTAAEAESLLAKKLVDIPISAANATAADAWERSMLAIVAVDLQCADTFVSVWEQLDATLRADTILFVTVTDGDDSAIY